MAGHAQDHSCSKVAGRKASRKDKAELCNISNVTVGFTFGRVLRDINPKGEGRKVGERIVRNRSETWAIEHSECQYSKTSG